MLFSMYVGAMQLEVVHRDWSVNTSLLLLFNLNHVMSLLQVSLIS